RSAGSGEARTRGDGTMTDQWYFAQHGQQSGPVSFVILQQMAANGQLGAGDLVWSTGMPRWIPADSVDGLMPARPQPPPQLPLHPADAFGPGRSAPYDEPAWSREPPRRAGGPGGPSLAGKSLLVAGMAAVVGVRAAVVAGVSSLTGAGGSNNPANPMTFSLRTGEMRTFHITFPGGKQAQIWVTSERNTDVDLFVCPLDT